MIFYQLDYNTKKDHINIFRRLSSFLKQPFYEKKYIILVKFIRIFCDWAYLSSNTLKMVTKDYFYKIGYRSSVSISREIQNINEITLTGFVKYILPCKIYKCCCLNFIRYPRVDTNTRITDSEMYYLLRDLSKFSTRTKIDIMDLAFVKDFLKTDRLWHEDAQYLRDMELSVLCGPIHGDFHRGNVLRFNEKLYLTDFETFERLNLHHFDFVNSFCFMEDVFRESDSWLDYFQYLLKHWKEIESHEYWSDLTVIEKKGIFYLYVIWRCHEGICNCESVQSDQIIKDILKQIRKLATVSK